MKRKPVEVAWQDLPRRNKLRIPQGKPDLTDFSQFPPARHLLAMVRNARLARKKSKNLNPSSREQRSSDSVFSLTVGLPNDNFSTLAQEVRYARRIYWKIAGRWTHLHFKSKEIIDRLKIDGVRVLERVSDYLESFDKLTINSNNQRNDAI